MAITRIGIIGAGTMGRGIAALCASAGLPVVLLDIPGSDDPTGADRSAPARNGLQHALKATPSAFLDPDRAALVTVGNTTDHLSLLAGCDWICEAIIEQVAPKQALFAQLELIAPNAIVTSNTSGIPMSVLLAGRSASFRERFCGTHYSNPPRFMHLLELIPGPETSSATITAMEHLHQRQLGKGIVVAKDVPGFIANRIGLAGWVTTVRLMTECDLTIDEVDGLTGPLIARSPSATFRTGDLIGLDTLAHVTAELASATGERFALPRWIQQLIQQSRLGNKTGAGFYQRSDAGIRTLDWKTLEYRPRQKLSTPTIEELLLLPPADCIRRVRALRGRYGDFVRRLLIESSHYCAATAPTLAYDIAAVDRAMEWGYGWSLGPFAAMDALGLSWLRTQFAATGMPMPPLLATAGRAFYRTTARGVTMLPLSGAAGARRIPLPAAPGVIVLSSLHRAGKVLDQDADARCVDLGDGVLCLEFCGSMNRLGRGAIELLARTTDRIITGDYTGLVIGNDHPDTFSAGSNLAEIATAAEAGEWRAIEHDLQRAQRALMGMRAAPFPVVAAPFGLTSGAGCELALHADRVQAHAELHIGFPEVMAGLLPASGGMMALLFRFTAALQPYEDADPFDAAHRAFKLIVSARASASAMDARKLGLLRPVADRISMNRDYLLADAKARVLDLAPDYIAPTMQSVRALGREALGNFRTVLWTLREAGQATEYDVRVGTEIAYVLSGGDGPPRDVTEQDILDLERDAFLRLVGSPETQVRVRSAIESNAPLRH
jgi:3-hydroxyacyl-CoA dehydrogenase